MGGSTVGRRLPCLHGSAQAESEGAAFPAFMASTWAGSEAAFPAFVGTAPKDHHGPSRFGATVRLRWTHESRSRLHCLRCSGRSREGSRLPCLPCRGTEGASITFTALTARLCHDEEGAFLSFVGQSSSTTKALPLHSPQGKCCRCRGSCSTCSDATS